MLSIRACLVAAAIAALTAGGVRMLPAALGTEACAAPANPIACENSKPGTPWSQWNGGSWPDWDIDRVGDSTIQGYATDISIDRGARIDFKIDTNAAGYAIEIYRLGWYQGDGARRIAEVTPSAHLPQVQPQCLEDPTTQLTDCGNWAVSASWNVPRSAVSGVYIARLTRTDTGGASHIVFVVRDDASHSNLVYQTSDPTWQAYNVYGGSDFYTGGPNGRAYQLSYNRPFTTRENSNGRDFVFSNEYPMIRFLERNGYDVSYSSGVDTDRRGELLRNHRVFLSVGHDEYWSKRQRDNVTAARDAGVNLAFFSGNEMYWKTRWQSSQDGSATPYRTLVCYKETRADAKIDPSSEWTGTWRDPRLSPPSDGGRPENGLTGTMYMANNTDLPLTVSAQQGLLRLWRNTSLSVLPGGATATLAAHTVGYESDEDVDNGERPAGLIDVSTTTGSTPLYLRDYGRVSTPGTTTHHMTLYRAASGALVFSAGTIQYSWALDAVHDGLQAPPDQRIQQATVNLLADLGAQPTALMSGLLRATPTTDHEAPVATITGPTPGEQISQASPVTVIGNAVDAGGGRVAAVEVSTDGGAHWHPATGTDLWTYTVSPTDSTSRTDSTVVMARAVDDSANIGPATTFKLA